MKQKDLIIVGAVAFVTALFCFILSNSLFGSPKKNPIKVPEVEKITSEFHNPQIDAQYKVIFNNHALDPTQLIRIGGNNNKEPFQGGQ
jgi:hypothetical protein